MKENGGRIVMMMRSRVIESSSSQSIDFEIKHHFWFNLKLY